MAARGGQQRIPRPPSFRPGRPAPWGHIEPASRRLPLAEVRARLATLPPAAGVVPLAAGSRAAAVLVPLFEEAGEARVILTKRPETMPSHQGEIAFPGGKYDPDLDANLEATARREAWEEVGIEPDAVDVVARLEGIATIASQFTITPFVGFLPGRPALSPDPREVVAVFDVALSELMADGVYREERWDTWRADLDVHFYELTGETVWGATARILTGFLSHIATGR
ncbi:MAG: pyrophosphohydrolase [Actinomycetia bacterium]|nr:pyrophosphohydrolase [Actinomycetes bacterium]